jgi:hypothetical protein
MTMSGRNLVDRHLIFFSGENAPLQALSSERSLFSTTSRAVMYLPNISARFSFVTVYVTFRPSANSVGPTRLNPTSPESTTARVDSSLMAISVHSQTDSMLLSITSVRRLT